MKTIRNLRFIKNYILNSGVYVVLLFYAIFTIIPILWLGSLAFKTQVQAFADPPLFFWEPTLVNIQKLFHSNFIYFFFNSLFIASLTTVLSLIIGAPAAWGLLKLDSKLSRGVLIWTILARMAPAMTYVIPFFVIYSKLGIIDTKMGLIFAYFTFNLPVVILIMRSFFLEIPQSLEEAAIIDGATIFQAFIKIILPLSSPGLVSTGIITFVICWNEFIFALVLTRRNAATIPIGILNLMTHEGTEWGQLGAAGLLVILPSLFIVGFVGKYLARGLTSGAVKG